MRLERRALRLQDVVAEHVPNRAGALTLKEVNRLLNSSIPENNAQGLSFCTGLQVSNWFSPPCYGATRPQRRSPVTDRRSALSPSPAEAAEQRLLDRRGREPGVSRMVERVLAWPDRAVAGLCRLVDAAIGPDEDQSLWDLPIGA